jgi:hypothetical protein
MQADFQDAHERHWQDAELLFDAQRLANADHLYGMAAESGLKRLMLAFGMRFDHIKDWPAERADREHAEKIWERFETYRCGHHQGSTYTLPTVNPFTDWRTSQRYSARQHFDEHRVLPHRSGAEQVRRLIKKAEREGLL